MPGYIIHISAGLEYLKNHPDIEIDKATFLRGCIAPDLKSIAEENFINFSNLNYAQLDELLLSEIQASVDNDILSGKLEENKIEKEIKKRFNLELKKFTHFQDRISTNKTTKGTGLVCSPFDFVKSNEENLNSKDITTSSFSRGYFFHLLTDTAFYNDLLSCKSKSLYQNAEETMDDFSVEGNRVPGLRDDFDVLNDMLIKKYGITLKDLESSGAWDDMKNWYTFKGNNVDIQNFNNLRVFSSSDAVCELIDSLGKIDLEHYINQLKFKNNKKVIER